MASLLTSRSIGQKTLPEGLGAIPTTLTAVSSKDSWIFQIVINNSTAGALTLTVQDQQTSAQPLLSAVSIPANTVDVITFPDAVKMINGIKWQASNTGLVGEIFGFTEP